MKSKLLLSLSLSLLVSTSKAQSEFDIDFGQFFEQGYGAEYDEEGMDLVGFQNENLAMVGWSERLSEPMESEEPEPVLQLDATLWYLDDIGAQQYERFYGSYTHDEVATGIARITDELFAMSVHKSPAWQRHVENGDELQVYMLTASGSVSWIYNHPSEEGSYAPKDIWYSPDLEHLYVLANKVYGDYATGTRTVCLLKLDLNGNLLWEQEHVSTHGNQITASEIVQIGQDHIMTVANNTAGNFPEFIEFNAHSPASNSLAFNSANNVFLFGIDYDAANQLIYTAGYQISEGQKDALVWTNDVTRSFINDFVVGLPVGREEFKDVNLTSDGFMAGGIRDNKGEGGDDVYIAHFDPQGTVLKEETMGGITDDRFSAFWLRDNLESGHFAGYDQEYGVNESGNAYLGGIVMGNFQYNGNCEFPRILLVDNLLDGSLNSTSTLQNFQNIITKANTHNFTILLLYDFDRLVKSNPSASNQSVIDMENFINSAISSGLQVGFIVGPDIQKVQDVTDIMNGARQWNFNFAAKIHYAMLEHEFWRPSLVTNLNGQNYSQNFNSNPYPNGSQLQKDQYFWELTKDHETLLKEIDLSKPLDANAWKTLDYISFFKNLDRTNPAYFEYNQTSPLIGQPNVQEHREDLADAYKKQADYTLLVFFRDATNSNHMGGNPSTPKYAFNTNDDYSYRFQAYSKASSNTDPFKVIPLFYNEQSSCGLSALGSWLGGSNTYRLVESDYLQEFNSDISSTCLSCRAHTQHSGFGWFKFTCVDDHGTFTGTGAHDRVTCSSAVITTNEWDEMNSNLIIYPNPTNDIVKVEINEPLEGGEFKIVSLQGVILMKGDFNSSQKIIDFSKYANGAYLLIVYGKNGSQKALINKR